METGKYPGQVVFGLDIGTRSIVGSVGYLAGEQFVVLAQVVREHQTRAMLDGQIHDIAQVGATITEVKMELEDTLGFPLKDVCIAAAGRVLKTVNVNAEIVYEEERNISQEDIYGLETLGVEKAYQKFTEENTGENLFYCVGYTVARYYLNEYPIGNLENHKARKIGADLIATFLPDDVVDGLYKAVEAAGLAVVNLTLEPIAAIQVAIPTMYRMLNIALVDVGAGTSDISITKDGAIVAYGMIPVAGDSLTETIAAHCLTDFGTAERIKRGIKDEEKVSYVDIMGLNQTISKEEVLKLTEPQIKSMAKQVSDKIKELNGGNPVSAIFIVGGGGKLEGYDAALADEMGIVHERVALRGEEVMKNIRFLQKEIKKDSLLVTPIGICLSYYAQSNNFIYVTFNHKRVKLYDNARLSVADAAMQADFQNSALFPRRGKELEFFVNGKSRVIRGSLGETAQIRLNAKPADITTPVHANDVIEVIPSTVGEAASCVVGRLPEYHTILTVNVNNLKVELPKFVLVNGQLQSEYYEIQDQDEIEITNYYTVEQLLKFLDLPVEGPISVAVNGMPAEASTEVYENFTVTWKEEVDAGNAISWKDLPEDDGEYEIRKAAVLENSEESENGDEEVAEAGVEVDVEGEDDNNEESAQTSNRNGASVNTVSSSVQAAASNGSNTVITVVANGETVFMTGKNDYIYVDIFDYIDFDLSTPQGSSVVTLLNGARASYVDVLKNGDQIEIYWEK